MQIVCVLGQLEFPLKSSSHEEKTVWKLCNYVKGGNGLVIYINMLRTFNNIIKKLHLYKSINIFAFKYNKICICTKKKVFWIFTYTHNASIM